MKNKSMSEVSDNPKWKPKYQELFDALKDMAKWYGKGCDCYDPTSIEKMVEGIVENEKQKSLEDGRREMVKEVEKIIKENEYQDGMLDMYGSELLDEIKTKLQMLKKK
jgi:hypothetical protein